MPTLRRIVIVGATSAIAQHCARLWLLERPANMTLVGRDADALGRVAADLKVRSPQSIIEVAQAHFGDTADVERIATVTAAQGAIDVVLVAHGSLPEQAACERDLAACQEALTINATSPALFAEAFAGRMAQAGHGTLAVIGSVAGDRGRKSNYVYGAAKGLLARYCEGLQHRMAGTAVRIVLVKPGPTDTPMTAGLKQKGARLAPVEDVARRIVQGIAEGNPVVYAPRRWWFVMLIVRHLPRFVFHKLNI
jgi:decaprenylphospho-beta-D-erythro-pentofuranosid-2-ulose 2-reductase